MHKLTIDHSIEQMSRPRKTVVAIALHRCDECSLPFNP
jgi:hypothetical protein